MDKTIFLVLLSCCDQVSSFISSLSLYYWYCWLVKKSPTEQTISDLTPFAVSTMTPVTATLKCYQLVCSLAAMFTQLCFCLTGDLHWDSGYAALWCFLHGLSLHNGEQQQQRYCLIHSSSQSFFVHLISSSLLFFISVMFSFSLHCLSSFLSILYSLCLSIFFYIFSSLLSVKQAPCRLEERACLVWVTATWSLTLPVLALTSNLPGGQLSEVFSLHWHVFEFLSFCCLLKHCFPPCLSTCKLLRKWIHSFA